MTPDLAAAPLAAGVAAKVDAKVLAAQREWRSPGVSVGVMQHGRLVHSVHVGAAALGADGTAEGAVPGTDDTAFLIGSVTKTFTALTIMALRDDGDLAIDDELSAYLGDTAHGHLRLRDLLAHASGLQREPVGRIWETMQSPDAATLMAGLIDAESVLPERFAFHYSNLAYALLGQVIEQVTGRDWEDVVRDRILTPLGMTRTGLVPQSPVAVGYHVDPFAGTATVEPSFELHAAAPLGGLWSTLADLAAYAGYLANPTGAIVSGDTLTEMCRPVVMVDVDGWRSAYGLGFGLMRSGDRVYLGHGGAMPGFLTGLQVSRPGGTGVIVSANTTALAAPLDLATALLTLVLDEAPAVVDQAWVPEVAQPDVKGLLGTWWSEGEPISFFVREGELWSRLDGGTSLQETRFAPLDTDTYRAVEGRERGERLEIVRRLDGSIERLYFATYALTRQASAFAQLSQDTQTAEDR